MGVFRHKFILLYIVIVLIVRIVGGADTDSVAIEKENENFEASERRFIDTLNDEDWHVAHLKETDFAEEDPVRTRRLNAECLPETFAQKVKRYRRTLRNDPALIDFVSAQALEVEESQLIQSRCNGTNIKNNAQNYPGATNTSNTIKPTSESEMAAVFPIMEYPSTGGNVQLEELENKSESEPPVSKKDNDGVIFRASKTEITNDTKVDNFTKGSVNQTLFNTTIVPQSIHTQINAMSNDTAGKKGTPTVSTNKEDKKSTETLNNGPEVVHQATTPKVKHKKEQRDARRGEYMFSSQEYYEDVTDFDGSLCPDVEQTVLELDLLRTYDVECELALEWISLDDCDDVNCDNSFL